MYPQMTPAPRRIMPFPSRDEAVTHRDYRKATRRPSDGDVAVLAPGALNLLAHRDLQPLDDHLARLGGVDDVVDHGPVGGDVGVDLLADHVDEHRLGGLRVLGRLDLLVEDDVDRALRPHHRDLGG